MALLGRRKSLFGIERDTLCIELVHRNLSPETGSVGKRDLVKNPMGLLFHILTKKG